jgi:hypothetical protein
MDGKFILPALHEKKSKIKSHNLQRFLLLGSILWYLSETQRLRPLKNTPFCSISALDSNFNPRNTPRIPPVKIFARLELKQNWAFFKGLLTHLTN